MTGEDKEGVAPEARPHEEPGAKPAEGQAEPGEAPEEDHLEAMRSEVEETRAHMLRALAEAENVRRRAQRDVTDARQYAVTAFARDLLNVADNFKRALSIIEGQGELPSELQGFVDGIRMTERELTSVFERHGVKIVEPTGERFDPNRHQAMFEIENPDVPSGTVLQVVQAGAVIGERTLRPAMVGVSKGGPKASEAQREDPSGPSGKAASDDGAQEPQKRDGEAA